MPGTTGETTCRDEVMRRPPCDGGTRAGEPSAVNLRVPFQAPSASLVRHELRELAGGAGVQGRDRRRRPRRGLRARRQQRAPRRPAAGQRDRRHLGRRQRGPRDLRQRRRQRVDARTRSAPPSPRSPAAASASSRPSSSGGGSRTTTARPPCTCASRSADRAAVRRVVLAAMGKRSRVKATQPTQADHRPAGRGRPPPAVPVRLRPALQGVPRQRGRCPRRAYVSRPFEGLARRVRPRRAARARARRDGAAAARATPSDERPPVRALLAAADGGAGAGPPGRHRLARAPGAALASATPAATSAPCCSRRLDAEPGEMVGLTEAPGDGPRLQDLLADEPLEVTVHDGFDFWVADVDDPTASVARLPRAGQRRRRPDRAADLGRGGVLDRRRHQGAPALGAARTTRTPLLDALARLHAAGEDAPRRRLAGSSGCSAPTACWSRCGTCRSAPVPRRSRSRWRSSRPRSRRAGPGRRPPAHRRGAVGPDRASRTVR